MQRDNVTESASGLPSSELGSIYSQKIPKKENGCKILIAPPLVANAQTSLGMQSMQTTNHHFY